MPKPGPPVVSISTTRETPSAFALLQGGGGVRATAGAAAGTATGVAIRGGTTTADWPVVVLVLTEASAEPDGESAGGTDTLTVAAPVGAVLKFL